MNDQPSGHSILPEGDTGNTIYKKDFWSKENLRYSQPHYRLQKSARIINKIANDNECMLLDVGCGPAALMTLLSPNIRYYGIDIAIHNPAPNLAEADFLEAPMKFDDKSFDIAVAQGVFEYVGDFQAKIFADVARLLNDNGIFIVSYVNFDHRNRDVHWPYSNIQSFEDFRQGLMRYFKILRFFPTSHNWHHREPGRKMIKAANMYVNINVPFISRILAVEYFFICSLP